AGYVVENVVLHVACALLLYALVWRTARRPWAALVAALLFVVHPVTTEAVTNVVGRADVLAAFGVLGGLLCWSAATTRRGWRRLLLHPRTGLARAAGVLRQGDRSRPRGRRRALGSGLSGRRTTTRAPRARTRGAGPRRISRRAPVGGAARPATDADGADRQSARRAVLPRRPNDSGVGPGT